MCGLVGYFGPWSAERAPQLERAANAIRHRGPDDAGLWHDAERGIGLAHRRLSILDLSQAGHQPMRSKCGRYVIAFNGEIYNHLDLRDELARQGYKSANRSGRTSKAWQGHADTETILAGLSHWGLEKTLDKMIGMFAFALWDAHSEKIVLARDAIGEKPLYFGRLGYGVGFASELKALRTFPDFNTNIDVDALDQYMNNAAGCVPAPHCIYQDSRKLPPGTTLSLSRRDLQQNVWPAPIPFWRLEDVLQASVGNRPDSLSIQSSVDALSTVLNEVVASQMLSDVPVGAFLSGGIDSTAIVATMRAVTTGPVQTFTVGFDDAGFDEAPHARAVARHLGTDHTELYLDAAKTRDVIPRLGSIYCEPFADQSQIPTVLIAQLASQHVKVCLSGDGGDEVFGGYRRYFETLRLWEKRARLPAPIRRSCAGLINALISNKLGPVLGSLQPALPRRISERWNRDSLQLVARLLAQESFTGFYDHLFASNWLSQDIVSARRNRMARIAPQILPPELQMEQMMAADTLSYLPDDILVKVDRASMAASLETRIPLLDKRVLALAWRMPAAHKFDNRSGKLVLRKLVERHLPVSLIDRPKQGFGVPISSWLRGPLKSWAHDLLHPDRISREGFFDPSVVQKRWQEHQSGKADWQYDLWNVLMFQSWLDESRSIATTQTKAPTTYVA